MGEAVKNVLLSNFAEKKKMSTKKPNIVSIRTRNMKFQKPKKTKLSTIRKYADRWFSRFVRLRDTQEENGSRYGFCVTCGKLLRIDSLECGHFVQRDKDDVRWNERNAHAQCKNCNGYRGGEQWKMGNFIERKYGPGYDKILQGMTTLKRRFFRDEIQAMGDLYKQKCEKILKTKLTDKKWSEFLIEWR